MIAILRYGQFTASIQLPEYRPRVSVIKPGNKVSFVPMTEAELASSALDKKYRLDFRVVKQLDEDIFLYEFECEV